MPSLKASRATTATATPVPTRTPVLPPPLSRSTAHAALGDRWRGPTAGDLRACSCCSNAVGGPPPDSAPRTAEGGAPWRAPLRRPRRRPPARPPVPARRYGRRRPARPDLSCDARRRGHRPPRPPGARRPVARRSVSSASSGRLALRRAGSSPLRRARPTRGVPDGRAASASASTSATASAPWTGPAPAPMAPEVRQGRGGVVPARRRVSRGRGGDLGGRDSHVASPVNTGSSRRRQCVLEQSLLRYIGRVDDRNRLGDRVGDDAGPGCPGFTESRSNSHGRRSSSAPPVSSRAPSEARSSLNIDGSNSSSWATQSASSSRQVGGRIPSVGPPSSSRASTAGTWPVAGSVQWGSSAWAASAGGCVAGVCVTCVCVTCIRLVDDPHRSVGRVVRGDVGGRHDGELRGDLRRGFGTDDPDATGRGTRWSRARRRTVVVRSPSCLSGPCSTLMVPPQERALGPAPVGTGPSVGPVSSPDRRPGALRSRGAPAPCGRAAGRWRPRGPG